MNSKENYFPSLDPDPGEGMLPRKRFHNLQMEVTVFQEATNLQPPLDPPQPPMDPAQPPPEIIDLSKYSQRVDSEKNKLAVPKIRPYDEALKNSQKDYEPDLQMC